MFYILGNKYYIPITIWIMDTHPMNAPLCYVNPTKDMFIKISMYVDHNGRIYLPYLHEWRPVIKLLKHIIYYLYINIYVCTIIYINIFQYC